MPNAEELTALWRETSEVDRRLTVEAFGKGGSESLVLFLKDRAGESFVRKVSSAGLAGPEWPVSADPLMLNPYQRAQCQVAFVRSMPPRAKALFPRVMKVNDIPACAAMRGHDTLVVDYEQIMGAPLSNRIIDGQEDIPSAYAELADLLHSRVHPHFRRRRRPEVRVLQPMHLDKMVKRLELAREMDADFLRLTEPMLTGKFSVNGQAVLAPLTAISRIREKPAWEAVLEPPVLSLVAGDTNTHNVIRCTDGSLRLIDPRGIGVEDSLSGVVVDDPLYDWKFWHNSIGHYDSLYAGEFNLRIGRGVPAVEIGYDADSPTSRYRNSGKHLESVVRMLSKPGGWNAEKYFGVYWRQRFILLMASHFLSMLPFHVRRRGAAGNGPAVGMFLEGVWWLAQLVDVLSNNKSSSSVIANDWWY